MIFSVVHPEENFYTAGCNFYRGTPGDGYDHRKVWSMTYISPTDYFWHDRLWTEHYARGTNRPLTGTGLEFILNMDKHYPRLRTALVHNSDGTDKIIRKGQYTERNVGCRNNPLWQQYRMLDTQWQYEGSDSPGIAENEYFSKLPYRRKHPEIRSLFIDNAGVILCCCPVCKKDAAKLEKEFAAKGGDTIAAKRELDARIPAYFNHLLHQISHKYSRVMMVNYTTGCAFVNLRQAQLYPPDTICWELTYMHPPWGRCLPYYKRGLAASAGVANSAVTLDFPLPGTMGDAMPVLTPDFTRMALAEGMATQSSYILKAEIRGKFFPAARQYNRFNALFPEVYSEAEQNGRIGIVCAVRSGLYDAVSDNIYDKLTNRLTAMGIPVEVITEDELNGKLRGRFDLLECYSQSSWQRQVFNLSGIPSRCEKDNFNGIVALAGEDAADCFSDAELTILLHGKLLLDGSAALALAKRGFADALGVLPQNKAMRFHSELDLQNGENMMLIHHESMPFLEITSPRVEKLSSLILKDFYASNHFVEVAPGCTFYQNEWGGRVAVNALSLSPGNYIFNALTPVRRKFWLRLLNKLASDNLPLLAVDCDQSVWAMQFSAENCEYLAIFNLGFDPLETIELISCIKPVAISKLNDNGIFETLDWQTSENGNLSIACKLHCYEFCVLSLNAII